ncbi:hypothetical protein DESUT3_30430 [Desulfuromonas versatilis]|uniref:DUF1318 domain-containing protein n=1 Tax=Desulfuromonas versatilis TaxID=2802975 RepID=A0ABM8HZM2_9BACT|nr:YdbL family protein [Desulfuromonas versatilis]BCR05974.1 hypothetical protein DESUT3_30430 [Desulfuromonas versatilis]
MGKLIRLLSLLAVVSVVACVTINIYFPAEEVRSAADKIVNEVWGERAEPPATPPAAPPAESKPPGSSYRLDFGPAAAHAQDINVSTPEIRAIKEAMKQRSTSLFPFLDSGHVGIGADGLLKVRSSDGLDLRSRGEVNRLVAAENADRQRLYQEIARANGFPERAADVQAIFADSWRQQASGGWYIEGPGGGWSRK